MNKNCLSLLSKAFAQEVNSAISGGPNLLRTTSKIADQLVLDGYLYKKVIIYEGRFPVEISGYELTDLGRMEYCLSCKL
jgi:hypothetical protein